MLSLETYIKQVPIELRTRLFFTKKFTLDVKEFVLICFFYESQSIRVKKLNSF